MDTTAISVIIPSYKPKDYLWECLESLVYQTLSKQSYEVIIILNGCNTPWKEQIEAYIQRYMHNNRVRLIQLDTPGVSNARNVGISIAEGQYVAFIDDDDLISPTYLEELYKLSDNNTMALSYELAFNDKDKDFFPYYITKDYYKYANSGTIPFYKARRLFNGPVYKLIPRAAIGERRFNVSFKNGEDSLFMFLISDNFDKVVFSSKEAVYYRRFRDNSATLTKRNIVDRANNSFKLILEYIAIYLSNPREYHFGFFITRLLGALKSIIVQ